MSLIEYQTDYTKIMHIFALILVLSNYNIFEDIIYNSFYKKNNGKPYIRFNSI